MKKIIAQIRNNLKTSGNPEVKQNYEKYFKGVVNFYGLKSPGVKLVFKDNYGNMKNLDINEQVKIAFKLLEGKYQEEKHIGILILNKIHKHLDEKFLKQLKLIIQKYVYDWATCDVLSGKVVTRILKLNPEYSENIKKRKDSKYMRVQRAACISFVNIARFGKYNKTIIDICTTTIKNPERFVQLGTGWVLRELSLADLQLVIIFIKKNYSSFSREGLRYAIEKMGPKLRKEMMDYGKK